MVITLLGTLKPLIQGPRLVVQIVLLIVFLYFFGQPAITRFLKKEVVVVETLKQTDGIPSPAITISVPAQAKHHSCFDKNVLAEDCLKNAYLKQSEIIKSVIIGVSQQKEVNLHTALESVKRVKSIKQISVKNEMEAERLSQC